MHFYDKMLLQVI